MQQKLYAFLNRRNLLAGIILLMMGYVLIEKISIYADFSVKYTDEDQCVLWLAADELMHGHFREPCFFGQSYNSCIEGWFAVPFLMLGLQFCEAIPLVTLLMSIIPFFLLAMFFFCKQQYLASVLVLFCLLFFSLDYKLISALPRGFITGVFFFGIGYVLLLRQKKYSIFWFSFFACLAFVLNETSVFLMAPVLGIYWKEHLRSKTFYLQFLAGAVLPFLYKCYGYYFYTIAHPEYNYFVKPKFDWSRSNLSKAMAHLDDWLFHDFTWIACCLLTIVALFIIRKRYVELAMIVITILCFFLIFGLGRVQDGLETIMFNKSRIFVFVPFMLAVLLTLAIRGLQINLKVQLFFAGMLFVLSTAHWYAQRAQLKAKIAHEVALKEKLVAFMPVADVYRLSYKYISICRRTGNDLILYDAPRSVDFILYITIPVLSKNEIRTFLPSYDRRTWLLPSLLNDKPEKILVLGHFEDRYSRESLKHAKRRLLIKGEDGMFEYKINKTLKEACEEDFKMTLRKH
jgi:hypothetical protein